MFTAMIALPAMLIAAFTLPPGMSRSDVFTLVAFVIGLMVAAALVVRDIVAEAYRTQGS
jgi:hypothetical protein